MKIHWMLDQILLNCKSVYSSSAHTSFLFLVAPVEADKVGRDVLLKNF